MDIKDGEIYDCEYLWAIQLSDLEGVRFIKVDHEGEEVAWSEDIAGILPFDLTDQTLADEDEDDEEDDDEGIEKDFDDEDDEDDPNNPYSPHPAPPILH